MRLSEIRDRLDERLRTDDYADVDASANGLQVGPAGKDVERAALAVDAATATALEAAGADADLLVAHHGIVWGGIERLTGRDYGRVAAFLGNDLALYVSHLPLDGHPELGNAAGLADRLGLEDREPFGAIGGETIGLRGTAPGGLSADTVRETLSGVPRGELDVRTFEFGPASIEDVAIVTGGGADWVEEAVAADVDAFVTGEPKQKVYHEAREAGLTVVAGGHYATETFGVRRLGDLLEDWGVETVWIDHPTGI